jgi:glycosyltransferase involved in cell wall biosynthesis
MSGRFRIAMIAACPFPAPRGTPIRIHRIADELGRRGHQIDVFTYHLGADSADASFRIHRIPKVWTYRKQSPGPSFQKLILLDPLLAVKLARAVRVGGYDVLHAHHAEGLLAALPAHLLYRIPLVFDVHTLLESELPYYRMGASRGLLARVGRAFDARLPKLADHVIAVSEEIRASLVDKFGYPSQSLSVIPNGVEASFTDTVMSLGARSLPPGPTVVYAGNLASYQRIDLLLQGFAAALAQRPDLWLQIYTDSSFVEFESLATQIGIRKRVRLASVGLDQLPGDLAAADVAVSSRTHCAGMPQKILNYMATGCPIVSFAGSAKHLTHERTGLIVADDDIQGFAEGMLRLIADKELARSLGAAARACARDEWGWSRAAERIEAVYDRLAR